MEMMMEISNQLIFKMKILKNANSPQLSSFSDHCATPTMEMRLRILDL
jgi:hypothetical protein